MILFLTLEPSIQNRYGMTRLTHIPIRTCVGCGVKKPKKELVRIVRIPDGSFSIDPSGKSPGRGAYICPNSSCVLSAKKKHKLNKSFRQIVPDSVYDQLLKYARKNSINR